jgi:hypothetical protein
MNVIPYQQNGIIKIQQFGAIKTSEKPAHPKELYKLTIN